MPVVSRLSFTLDGRGFDEGVPILKVTDALRDFHLAVDKAYLSILSKEKISRQDRAFYKLTATRIGIGSFHSDIQIIVPAWQVGLGFLPAGITPTDVWEILKSAFGFLRSIASSRRDGNEPKVQVTSSGKENGLVVIGNDNRIQVNQIVYNAATRSERHIKSLARLVDGEQVSKLSALDEKEEGIQLTPADNDLFNPVTHVEDTPLEIDAKIFRLDVESRSGRLRILSEGSEAEYPFEIIGKQALHAYIIALEQPRSLIKALREIVRHPSGIEIVHAYHVLEVLK